jgi:hypothetical protein
MDIICLNETLLRLLTAEDQSANSTSESSTSLPAGNISVVQSIVRISGRTLQCKISALYVLGILTMLLNSCDPMTTVTFVNQTPEKLTFYLQSNVQAALLGSHNVDPGSSAENWMIDASYRWLRVGATTLDGDWVFDHTYQRGELERLERRIVVSSLERVPAPAGVKAMPRDDALPAAKTKIAGGGTPKGERAPTPTPTFSLYVR